ncbi:MAG: hypothetical protein AAFP68_13715 [Pseudomonadota bacterium]
MIERERGVALLAVVSFTLVITVIALGVTRDSRDTVQAAILVKDRIETEALAEAAELWAGLVLAAEQTAIAVPTGGPLDIPRGRVMPTDGTAMSARISDRAAVIRISAERGKVDLLSTPQEQARRLILASGVPQAPDVAEAIARLRTREDGAARLSWRIGNRPINSLGEFAAEAGLSSQSLAALRRTATVESGATEPDAQVAPHVLFRHLDLSEEDRARMIAARSTRRAPAPITTAQVYTIETEIGMPGTAQSRRVRMIEIEPNGRISWFPLGE